MIHLIITFCLLQNPYLCRSLEIVPEDYRAITSTMDCMMGGAVGGMQFTMDHADWSIKGWRCEDRKQTAGDLSTQLELAFKRHGGTP